MRKVLGAILLTGLFLLLLSALVVTPEDAAVPPPPPRPNIQAVFLPMPGPSAPTANAALRPAGLHLLAAFLTAAFSARMMLSRTCDSNGRVLRAVRYENCVYQLFRPEVAGG